MGSDVDWYSVVTTSANATIHVRSYALEIGNGLDTVAGIFDSAGTLLAAFEGVRRDGADHSRARVLGSSLLARSGLGPWPELRYGEECTSWPFF